MHTIFFTFIHRLEISADRGVIWPTCLPAQNIEEGCNKSYHNSDLLHTYSEMILREINGLEASVLT